MFVVEIVAALTTIIFVRDLVTGGANLGFTFQIILWLWFTVLFANFAEAVAEGRGKAQAESLKKTRTESQGKLLTGPDKAYRLVPGQGRHSGELQEAPAEVPLQHRAAGKDGGLPADVAFLVAAQAVDPAVPGDVPADGAPGDQLGQQAGEQALDRKSVV